MLFAPRGRERVHGGSLGVLGQDPGEHVQEHALAVATRAVDEHQRVLAGDARETVAAPLLQEADQRSVATGGLVEEGEPARAFRCISRRYGSQLSNALGRLGWPHPAGAQVHRAARRAQEPRIAVPDL